MATVVIVASAGCAGRDPAGTPAPAAPASNSAQPAGGPSPVTAQPGTLAASAPGAASQTVSQAATNGGKQPESGLTVRYDWGVPNQEVTVADRVAVPPVPTLVEVQAGDHSAEGYERVTFAFRSGGGSGGFPGYRFRYVQQVVQDGSGDPVRLPGRGYLQIVFNPAYAHDDAGRATVRVGLQRPGFRQISGYQLVGDYEAYVSYGFGFVAERPQIRVGERKRPDGTLVVAVDVRSR